MRVFGSAGVGNQADPLEHEAKWIRIRTYQDLPKSIDFILYIYIYYNSILYIYIYIYHPPLNYVIQARGRHNVITFWVSFFGVGGWIVYLCMILIPICV